MTMYSRFKIKEMRSKQLFDLLEKEGALSREEMVIKTGIPRTTIYESLVPLLRAGKIETYKQKRLRGERRGRPSIVYRVVWSEVWV